MINSKYIDRIIAFFTALAVIFSLLTMTARSGQSAGRFKAGGAAAAYEKELFDTKKPISVEITIDQDQWKELLENAAEKKWHSCDLVINGRKFHDVGIRTKGANSLESVAENPDSSRYSFKLRFDKTHKGQKCWGLDKLCLNNNYGDPSHMKEALVYDMFRYLGAAAPLYNYAIITVNGQYWGVYLALEAVDQSFLQRNYGRQTGACYKPGDTEETEGQSIESWDMDEFQTEDEEDSFFFTGGGSDLKYIDDDPDSYYDLWPAQVNRTTKADHRRVIEALKKIKDKKDPETSMDIGRVIQYMAVHNFSVNYDSLSGDGNHNYYLHEKNGRLSIIPWDYNLCFGAYTLEDEMDEEISDRDFADSSKIVNSPIDDHYRVTDFFDGILDNESCRARYHETYQRLIEGYVFGKGFDAFYARTRKQIDELVRTDPNALYSYDAYDKAAKMLQKMVRLRGLSVWGQLVGTIPAKSAGQKEHPEKLIAPAGLDLTVLGSDEPGNEMEEWTKAEDSDEDWITDMDQYTEQQKQERRKIISKNCREYILSLAVLLWTVLAAKICRIVKYRKKYHG